MKNKKVAVVGLGAISRLHVEAIQKLDLELTYLCDVRSSMFSDYNHIQSATFVTDYKEINEVDCVHICTDHCSHYEIVKYFLKRGVDVFCEKVLTISYNHSKELIELSKANNCRLAVCYQNRYNPNIEFVQNLIEKKEYGNLKGVYSDIAWNRESDYYKNSWQSNIKIAGGGVLTTQASHTIDLLIRMLGNYKIKSKELLYREEIEVETSALVMVDFETVACTLFATVESAFDNEVRFVFDFEKMLVILDGNNILLKENGIIKKITIRGSSSLSGKVSWGGYHELAIRRFYEGDNLLEVEESALVEEFLDEIYDRRI